MAYSRQVELVDLSNTRHMRPRNTGHFPRESLCASAGSPLSPTHTRDTPPASPASPASSAGSALSASPAPASATSPVPPVPPASPASPASSSSSGMAVGTKLPNNNTSEVDEITTAQLTRLLSAASMDDDATFPESTDISANLPLNKSVKETGTRTTAPEVESCKTALSTESREELFRRCLNEPVVDIDELRRIIWAHGVPTVPWARPLAWKLLTGYLPPDRGEWTNVLAEARARYWAAVHDATVDPSARPVDGDHPLNDDASSQWREFFLDADMRSLISRDVMRTHPDLHRATTLREALERMLFVYAKRHSTLGYRQGMNELAAPFLLVFTDDRAADASDVEADAYFCFEAIMAEMATCYVPKESETEGIGRQLRELQALLRIKDPQLESHLESLGVDPRFYGLRWIRLWMSQEFALPDCLVLWDSFLTAEVHLPWIRYVCVAMLIRVRDRLLHADFTTCMKTLLNYPECEVAQLLRIADRLRISNAVIVRTSRK